MMIIFSAAAAPAHDPQRAVSQHDEPAGLPAQHDQHPVPTQHGCFTQGRATHTPPSNKAEAGTTYRYSLKDKNEVFFHLLSFCSVNYC